MTEKELEKLFKTKLAGLQHEYNPAAWQAMEKELAQSAGATPLYYWRSVVATLLFGVVVSGIIWLQPGVTQNRTGTSTAKNIWPQPLSEMVADQRTLIPFKNGLEPKPASYKSSSDNSRPEAVHTPNANLTSVSSNNAEAPNIYTGGDSQKMDQRNTSPSAGLAQSTASSSPYNTSEKSMVPAKVLDTKELDLWPTAELNQAPVSAGTFKPEVLQKFARKHELLLMGGPVLNESFNNNDLGVAWQAGIVYQYRISNQWVLSAGLNYAVIDQLGVSQQIDSTFYHFGSERVEIENTGQRLEYLEMPIKISWVFNARHQFGIGAYASHLVSVSEVKETRHYQLETETNAERSVKKGPNSKYRPYDLGIGLSYYYQVNPQFSFGLDLRKGLTDITYDIGQVYQNNHQNLNTRLTLRYRLF
ncbi:MAG: outer membrane beta-barrel protein [Owenweeksia sp.]|nr:outer membrane beta-barrel protein [Owenweeksia sp.]